MEDPLAQLGLNIQTPTLVSSKKVPNVWPTLETTYKLAIVGEAPGADEEAYGTPFVGASGKQLDTALSNCGVARDACYIGNVCQYRPPGNKIEEFGKTHEHVVTGRAELLADLDKFRPNCILALGNWAMWALTDFPFGDKHSTHNISEYACFITPTANTPLKLPYCSKLVGSYHPAAVLRNYKLHVLLRLAVGRARAEAETPILTLPVRNFELDLSASDIILRLESWPAGLVASLDIEGGLDSWICMSVVSSPDYGFIIAFGSYSLSDQARVYRVLSKFLYRLDIPKVLQNSLYEGFVLGYGFNMQIRNIVDDTMLKQWEIYPELPKGLDTVGAIWTREPQWKFLIAYSLKEQRRRKKLPYYDPAKEIRNKHLACCIDSAVTLEACRAQDGGLTESARRHYNLNMDLLNPLLYMELRGIRYNREQAQIELGQVNAELGELATRLQLRAGYDLRGAKGSISSTKLAKCLYEEKNYPVQKDGRGPNAKVTTAVDALLTLKGKKEFANDPFLTDILRHRKLESIRETLEVSTDPDGRVRCGYNIVGTETGRLTCYTSPTGSGANLTTITKKLRKLYIADEGYHLFQCDLSGADGWTVAARSKALGDSTMWDDYTFGLKPAKILAMMYHHGVESTLCSREELKRRCDEESIPGGACDQDGWLYFGCKRIQHGTNYGMMEKTMARQIMEDSYKITGNAIYVPVTACGRLRELYLQRYIGVKSFHSWAEREVLAGHHLIGASGHERKFYGRRKGWNAKFRQVEADQDTWREFLADEPQENTTYATNLALHRLWFDPENRINGVVFRDAGDTLRATRRRTSGGLIIPPAHHVHDALIGQLPKDRVEWATTKIANWFDNTLTIANFKLIIPFEGAFGPSWGEQGNKYGGGKI